MRTPMRVMHPINPKTLTLIAIFGTLFIRGHKNASRGQDLYLFCPVSTLGSPQDEEVIIHFLTTTGATSDS